MTNGVRRRRALRAAIAAVVFAALVALSFHSLPEHRIARAACVASGALVLWLSELIAMPSLPA